MRLSEFQYQSIRNVVADYLSNYELKLFGSRTDDNAKGGDIDLLILTDSKLKLDDKWAIRREIEKLIGQQKIDIVNFTFDEENPFKELILENAIKL
jgi:predicted nucleotidyltransferase